jgi:glycosyltransferase 2 family protein
MRNLLKTALRLLLCLALLLWVFHNIFMKEGMAAAANKGLVWNNADRLTQWRIAWSTGPVELWHNLCLIPAPIFILSLIAMGATLLLGIIRWRMVLKVHGLNLSFGRASEISFVAHFFNSFLLGSTGGDLMKAYYAARETHHKKAEAVSTVVVDRLIGLWAMLIFAGLMMIPNLTLLFEHARLRGLAYFILAMLAGCTGAALLALRGGVSKAWGGARVWLRRLPKGESLERLLDACRYFGQHRRLIARTLLISMVLNAICVVQLWIIAWGLGLTINPIALFVIVPMIICISALPITPSGLGVRENLFVFMLQDPSINVDPTRALSLSLLAYFGFLIWSIIGGGVYMMFKDRHHLAEADLDAKTDPEETNKS